LSLLGMGLIVVGLLFVFRKPATKPDTVDQSLAS